MATAYRAIPKDWTFWGLCWLVVLTAGCGSSVYDDQLEATTAELREDKPAAPAGAADEATAEDAEAEDVEADELIYESDQQPANNRTGAGGTGVGNAIGLAPM